MTRKVIEDFAELKALASRTSGLSCFMSLNGGLRSSKQIDYDPAVDEWYVFQGIDGVSLEYKSTEAFKEEYPFLFEALEKGCLVMYEDTRR